MSIRVLIPTALILALAACSGDPGTDGLQGPRGPAGTNGTNGTDGVDGVDGTDGVDGVDGTDGTNGVDGIDGADGLDGLDGTNGVDGRNAYVTGGGLIMELQSAAINGTTATTRFLLTDASGIPLDLDGRLTQGAVSVRFVLAWLGEDTDGEATEYTAYTTRAQTSPITGVRAVQASTDSGGTFSAVAGEDGVYEYTFGTAINVADASKTHTIAAFATRSFEGVTYVSNANFNFVPGGAPVTVTKESFDVATCNRCHDPLSAHGGSRRDGTLCITCHSSQTVDPDTGNTVDMRVMIHRIHRGEDLPSVAAGEPYQIIGHGQSLHDYSKVVYPGVLQDCSSCHTSSPIDYARTRPSRLVCTSCHDDIAFEDPPPAGKTLHTLGAQADDRACASCHPAAGTLFSIETVHLASTFDPATPELELALTSVSNATPGALPSVTFTVALDGAPRDIITNPLNSLRLLVAGPTTDIESYWQVTIQGSGATGVLVREGDGYRYTMGTPMPATAAGSYAFAFEGYIQASGGPRIASLNPILTASVTDPSPVERRMIVAQEKCESCHYQLQAHGGGRRSVQYCVTCHNPNNANDDRIARFEDSVIVAPSVNLKDMIHRIHRGEHGANPYVLGGNPSPSTSNPAGNQVNFGEVLYPGDLRNCEACHLPNTYGLPLERGLLPSTALELTCIEDPAADTNAYCNNRVVSATLLLAPEAAACNGCHDSDAARAHAELNTTLSGLESCAVCHGNGREVDVLKVHAR